MPQFTTKPAEVEVRQWDGTAANAHELVSWVLAGGMSAYFDNSNWPDALYIVVNTLNGPLHASPGDALVCGVLGEFSVYKPDVLAASFDPA